MQAGSVRRTLRRGGAVSGAALFFALAAGGLSLASAPQTAPDDGGLLPPVTAPVTGTVDTVSGLLPTPAPAPAPDPTNDPVDDTVKTVQGTVSAVTKTATDTVGGLLGTAPKPTPPTGNGGSTPSGHHPGGTTGPTSHGHTGTVTPSTPTTPTLPHGVIAGYAPTLPTVPAGVTRGQAALAPFAGGPDVAAAAAPQLRPEATNVIPGLGDLGSHSLPAGLVVLAVTAVAGVAASHIGVWQNRLRPVATNG